MKRFISTKLVRPLRALLTQGATPRQLSLAVALSVPLGIIPFFGFITPLATAMALRLRLNVPLVVSLLYLIFPLQLLLFIPFLRAGELLFHLPPLPFSPSEIMTMMQTNRWGLFQRIWMTNLAALGVWLLLALPLAVLLYQLSLIVFRRFLLVKVKKTNS